MIEPNSLILGDCIEKMQEIPDKSIDAIICDLPYNTCASKWDKMLPFDKMWEQYKRIVKKDRAIVLFATQPFTTKLIASNYDMFKYCWTWYKHSAPNFLNAKTMPLKVTEDICVFGFAPCSYNKKGEYMLYHPQFGQGKPYSCKSGKQKTDTAIIRDKENSLTKQGGGGLRKATASDTRLRCWTSRKTRSITTPHRSPWTCSDTSYGHIQMRMILSWIVVPEVAPRLLQPYVRSVVGSALRKTRTTTR